MIDPVIVGLAGFILLLVLLLVRLPIGISMLLVSGLGVWVIRPQATLPILGGEIFNQASNPHIIIIPLFILLGNIVSASGLGRDLYDAAYKWIGHLKGGLASATILGSASFSALSGSSLAAAVTIGKVALPQMKRFNYHGGLAAGSVAAGGTLGILIPPSAGFVIYGLLAEESINRLFIAGVVPGLILTFLFIFAIWLQVKIWPHLAPIQNNRADISERLQALWKALPLVGLIICSIGGIYFGLFTASEAAGIAAILATLIMFARGRMTQDCISRIMSDTLVSTGQIFMILFGAFAFKTFIGLTGISYRLMGFVYTVDLSATTLIAASIIALIILGMFMDGFAILVLAVPILEPTLTDLNVDMIWFGVLMVIVLEMGLITPPVGLNVFIVSRLTDDASMLQIFKGIVPFWIAMAICAALILAVPSLATYLPDSMLGHRY
jgi:tripartite ATP-independent transporter DctM subunit